MADTRPMLPNVTASSDTATYDAQGPKPPVHTAEGQPPQPGPVLHPQAQALLLRLEEGYPTDQQLLHAMRDVLRGLLTGEGGIAVAAPQGPSPQAVPLSLPTRSIGNVPETFGDARLGPGTQTPGEVEAIRLREQREAQEKQVATRQAALDTQRAQDSQAREANQRAEETRLQQMRETQLRDEQAREQAQKEATAAKEAAAQREASEKRR